MALLGIDGLASGLDTTSIIASLMNLEARPQTLLKSSLQRTRSFADELRSLNSAIAAIATAARAKSGAGALALYKASSSAESVRATVAAGATAASVTFTVNQTAQAQSIVTKEMPVWEKDPPVLTVVAADGTTTEFTAASTAMTDIAAAINGSGTGVSAALVRTGVDASGKQLYRLQITADETGAAGGFTIYRGPASRISTGPQAQRSVNLATEAGAATVAAARDASLTLWSGTASAETITSSTNTFSGLLPGVDVTVTKVEAASVTVTVARDAAAAKDAASTLMQSLIDVFASIAAKTEVLATTRSGGASTSTGVFSGESGVRQAKNALLDAAVHPVAGRSPSSIGISVTRDGTIAFDAEKFAAEYAKDPSAAGAMFETIAGRIEAAASAASDKHDGYLTTRISGQESLMARLDDQIEAWDDRLVSRREHLQRIYASLETSLASLNSQSAWLTSQLGSLPVPR